MTEREQEILSIIAEHPMISQNEIADQLSLTRSSVSVYIANMVKSGVLKGRGYIVAEEDYPIIIGSAAVDINSSFSDLRPQENSDWAPPQRDCSISFTYSGGAKNLAEHVVRLGGAPKIISAVARDFFGSEIIRECNQHGISTELCPLLDNAATTIFLNIFSPQQDIAAMTSNQIDRNITPEFLESRYIHLKKARQIVIEDRMSTEAIDYITSTFQSPQLFLMASRRLSSIPCYNRFLDRFSVLLFSFPVAAYLCGIYDPLPPGSVASASLLREMAAVLRNKTGGDKHILFPAYGNKLCYICGKDTLFLPLPGDDMTLNAFGFSRDAMMAGLMYCQEHGFSPEETLFFVGACHQIASLSKRPVNRNFCLNLVLSTMESLKKSSAIGRL